MNRSLNAALAAAAVLLSTRATAETPADSSSAAPAALATPTPTPTAAAPATAPAMPIAAPAAAPAAARQGPVFWGFIDAQFSQTVPHPGTAPVAVPGTTSANGSTFELRRARIGVRGDVVPDVGYAILYDGADTSLKDAYIGARQLPGLEVRAGQWKTPFGYEQQESDTKLLWVNTSYVIANLARGPDSRDIGAGVIGKWTVAAPVVAELAASVVDGAGPNRKDDLDEKNVWSRAGVAAKLERSTVRAGGSFGYGRQADYGKDKVFGIVKGTTTTPDSLDDTYFYFKTYGADVTVDTPWAFVAAELVQSDRAVSRWTASTTSPPGTVGRSDVTARGWYVGAYGKTPWNVGPIFRYDRYDPSRAAREDAFARYTVGAYVDVLPVNARLIFNYELDDSQQNAEKRPGNRAILFGQVVF